MTCSEDNALYATYVLILVLGLRKGEVLGLTWDDVDCDAVRPGTVLSAADPFQQL